MINNAIKRFYRRYAPYLGNDTANQLIQMHITSDAISSLTKCINIVEEALRAVPQGNVNQSLAGVKGVNIDLVMPQK